MIVFAQLGADVNALTLAARNGRTHIVKSLLDANANIPEDTSKISEAIQTILKQEI